MERGMRSRAHTLPAVRLGPKATYWDYVRKSIARDWQLYVLLFPLILWYILFTYKPMYGLQIAFKDYSIIRGITDSPWVGFKHFQEFLQGEYFWRVMKNTLLISVYSLVFGFPAPILLAVLLNEVKNKRYKKVVQTATYLPHFLSIVVVCGMVVNMLSPSSGLINHLIRLCGGEGVYFLSKPEYFRTIYVIMNIWKETGFSAIVFMAAIAGIDMELYEAAVVDGANRFRQIWHVTLPGILPTVAIMLILRLGSILNVGYEAIILLYQPATYETSDVISTYIYRTGLTNPGGAEYDFAAAVGMFNSVISFLLVIVSNAISKKITEQGIW